MLGTLFDAGHAGFGGQISGAMDRMWDINQHNASRGGGGGRQAAPSIGVPTTLGGNGRGTSQADVGLGMVNNLAQARNQSQANSIRSQGSANDFIWKARQPEFQGPLQAMFGFGGWGMGGQSPFGAMPTQFNTNYGASGSVSNPNPQFR